MATTHKSGFSRLYQLATQYRPTRRRVFTCWASAGDTRVDIATDGIIYIGNAVATNGTVSVEISYFIE